jgi:hypothetical protein
MLRLTLNPRPLTLRLEALADRLTDLRGLLNRLAPVALDGFRHNDNGYQHHNQRGRYPDPVHFDSEQYGRDSHPARRLHRTLGR